MYDEAIEILDGEEVRTTSSSLTMNENLGRSVENLDDSAEEVIWNLNK